MAAAAAAGPGAPRTKTKKKQKRFVPQRVKVPRAADPLLAVLAWGVNHQINELSQVPPPVMLLPDDFKANSKIKVNNHLFNRSAGKRGGHKGLGGHKGYGGVIRDIGPPPPAPFAARDPRAPAPLLPSEAVGQITPLRVSEW
ncbi:phosphatidylinositol 5-phosphate 4-kinase type-2 gamma [Coturnix japonica]|uniref:phosphatidylinositol 5-phosphate 4-kinase type-2 gamma n=1 Tax=Coturnix japonica TaxID=93934 RepID=UPI0013A5E7B0|nr:phosphatidylinositol 5-phosphate 4-kinase type-2 gamma [Coturnix japonica]